MERLELNEYITALTDNEINDSNRNPDFDKALQENRELRYEYQIHSYMKRLVRERVGSVQTPSHLRERILRDIIDEIPVKKKSPTSVFDWLKELSLPLKYAFAAAALILALYFMLPRQDSSGLKQIAMQQQGRENMIVQARSNFRKIIDGNFNLQFQGSDPQAVKKFFKDKGVKYETMVPQFRDWHLMGAVVSDDKGEKLAHHVYKTDSGKMIYFYQAEEGCFKNNRLLSLSDGLKEIINKGNYYKYKDGTGSMLVWKDKGNVFVILSDDDLKKLEDKFTLMRK